MALSEVGGQATRCRRLENAKQSGHLRPHMAGIRCITGPRDRGTSFTSWRAMEVGGRRYIRSVNLTGESGIGFLADVD